jgi:competence protein ComEC
MTLKVALLDVGHRDCAVVYSSDRTSVMVIDCGNGPVLVDFLKSEGLHHVDIAIATHNDADHVGGMTHLLQELPVGLLAIHQNIKDSRGLPKRVTSSLVDAASSRGILFAYVNTQDSVLLKSLASLCYRAELLYPSPLQAILASKSNTTSGLLRVEWANRVVLFSGDLDSEGWDRLLEDKSVIPKIKSHVFKFPHHGGRLVPHRERRSSNEYTLSLLRRVAPKITLISTAQHGQWQHPDPSVLDGLRTYAQESSSRFLCTQATSACDKDYKHKRSQVLAMLPSAQVSKCSRLGCPCAGTIRLRLESNGTIVIEADKEYQQIVRAYANRQCVD